MIRVKGFTLIEILVAMAITVILASGTYVGFSRFNRQQNLNIARDTLYNNLSEARSNAMSQVITRCTIDQTLEGYQISFNASSTPHSYTTQEVCRNLSSGNLAPPQNVKTVILPPNVIFGSLSGTPVMFSVLSGSVASLATITLRFVGAGGPTRTVTVNNSGVISSN